MRLCDDILSYYNPIPQLQFPLLQLFKSAILSLARRRFPLLISREVFSKKNILLSWKSGFLKSTLIENIYSVLCEIQRLTNDEFRVKRMTTITKGALTGSINGTGRNITFVPPDFALYDVIVCDELAPFLSQKDDIITVLLKCLDNYGFISKKLVKFGSEILRRMINSNQVYANNRIRMLDDYTLTYYSKASMITATHTLTIIPLKHYHAFLSRFDVVTANTQKIDEELREQKKLFIPDSAKEREIAEKLCKIVLNSTLTNEDYIRLYRQVHDYIIEKFSTQQLTPRDKSQIVSDVIATKFLLSSQPVNFKNVNLDDELISHLNEYVYRKIRVSRRITDVITKLSQGATFVEILNLLGEDKSAVLMFLRQLRAKTLLTGGGVRWFL